MGIALHLLGGVQITISANSDFNTFTKPGVVYVSRSGATSTSLSNRPSDLIAAFILFAPLPTVQVLITTWEPFNIYKRSWDREWKKWQKIAGTAVEYAE